MFGQVVYKLFVKMKMRLTYTDESFVLQAEGIPPHLLRQYVADQGSPAQTQVIPRVAHVVGASPPAARFVRQPLTY